jgi:hypothetical protein
MEIKMKDFRKFAGQFDTIDAAVKRMRPMLEAVSKRRAELDMASLTDLARRQLELCDDNIAVIERELAAVNMAPVEAALRSMMDYLGAVESHVARDSAEK